MKNNEDRINKFIAFFTGQFNYMKDLEIDQNNKILKKSIYVSILDALSKTVCNPGDGNRERFLTLIDHFSGWSHKSKISTPHLAAFLRKMNSPEFSAIKEFTNKKLENWHKGEIVTLDEDLSPNEVNSLWPKGIKKTYDDLTIDHMKHLNLFYKYRNNLVHEFRQPGRGIEYPEDIEPYYHTSQNSAGEIKVELVYPIRFYETLLEKTL